MTLKADYKRKKKLVTNFLSEYAHLVHFYPTLSYEFTAVGIAPDVYLNLCPDANEHVQWLILHSSKEKIMETEYDLYENHHAEFIKFCERVDTYYRETEQGKGFGLYNNLKKIKDKENIK